jgi:hypothetical protein
MPSITTTVTASQHELAAAFTEWDRRYREEPDRFVSEAQHLLKETPETYGEACAPYLIKILSELGSDSSNTLSSARQATPPDGIVRLVIDAVADDIRTCARVPSAQDAKDNLVILQHVEEQGGIYAGRMRGSNGHPDYHLFVATAPMGFIRDIEWGGRGVDRSDATSEFDGLANTLALARHGGHPAAEWASSLAINGHHDWYLPSRRELRLLWCTAPELFEPGWYWSSTQYSANVAWFQYFDDGGQGDYDKDYQARARAVRRFLIT